MRTHRGKGNGLVGVGVVVAIALVLTACGKGGSASPASGASEGTTALVSPMRIVVEGPMTGDQSATGLDMWNAAQLAVDERGGAVLGREIDLVQGDDAADAATGVALAEKDAATTFAVIGPYNSSVGIENLPIWIEGGTIPVHLTSDNATDGMGYTVQPKNDQVAPIESTAIHDWLKAQRVAIVYDESTYTAGIAAAVKKELTRSGVDVVLYEGFPEGEPDVETLADDVAAAKPDLFYLSTYFPQGGELAKSIAPKVDAQCFAGLANQDGGFVDAAGLDVARSCVVSGVPSADQFPEAKTYVEDYRAAYDQDPGTWGTFTYDSVNLLLDAVEKAESFDPAAIEDVLSQTRDWPGITGPVTIDATTGNRVEVPVVVLDVNAKGEFVVDPKWSASVGFAA